MKQEGIIETDYFNFDEIPEGYFFTLRQGSIADYKGDAIVVPCWSNFVADTYVSYEIEEKLESLDIKPTMFELTTLYKGFEPFKVEDFEAVYYNDCQLPDVKSTIMAVRDKEFFGKPDFYLRAAKLTKNVLRQAKKFGVESIAFPVFLNDVDRGNLSSVLPAMIDEFVKHKKDHHNKNIPELITLYVPDVRAYNQAKKIADHKLE